MLCLACSIGFLFLVIVPNEIMTTILVSRGKASGFDSFDTSQSQQESEGLSPSRNEMDLSSIQHQRKGEGVNTFVGKNYADSRISYSQSSNFGISGEDQSPQIAPKILKEEDVAERRMKKLHRMLKRSEDQQSKLIERIKSLHDFIGDEISSVKDMVGRTNTELTDDISSLSHNVPGPEGPPGLPGCYGIILLKLHPG